MTSPRIIEGALIGHVEESAADGMRVVRTADPKPPTLAGVTKDGIVDLTELLHCPGLGALVGPTDWVWIHGQGWRAMVVVGEQFPPADLFRMGYSAKLGGVELR